MSEPSTVQAVSTSSPTSVEGLRAQLRRFLSKPGFEFFIITLIVINAISLGLETSPTAVAAIGSWLGFIDRIILAIFVVELVLRIFAFGQRFWRDGWSIFDLIVVSLAVLPATGDLSALRALRVVRALRLISVVPSMKRVVTGLIASLPGMASIVTLLLLIFYVFSVMATKLFGASHPDLFGTLGRSAFTLFQVMTLEGWSDGIARPVMVTHWWAWIYFIIFILITAFAVLNLFIGVIVDAMQAKGQETLEEMQDQALSEGQLLMEEIKGLRRDVATMKSLLAEHDRSGGAG